MNHATVRPIDPSSLRSISRAAVALRGSALSLAGAQVAARLSETIQGELKAPFRCQVHLRDEPARSGGLPEGCCYIVLALGTDGRRALVELESGFAAALVDRLSGGKACAFAPQELSGAEVAAVSFLALHAVRAARSVEVIEAQLAPRFVLLARDSEEAAGILAKERSWVSVELELAVGECRGSGRLLLPAPTAHRLSRLPDSTPRRPLAPEIGLAQLAARVVGGSVDLSEDELSQLSEGDAIVLSDLTRSEGVLSGEARLLFPDFHLIGQLAGPKFTLASIADALSPEAFMHDCPTLVSSLPIEVQVELARIKIPLSKLDQLQAGSVLELSMAITDVVLLKVGDRAVARAELVDVDGEVAARIVSLMP